MRFAGAARLCLLCLALALALGAQPASAATLAVDKTVSMHQKSAGSSISSPAFSTSQPGELLLAFIASDGPSGGGTQTISSVSGGGLVWRLRTRANGRAGTAEIWAADAPATLTNATVTATRGNGSYPGSIAVVGFTGADLVADGATATASAASGEPKATLTATRAGSQVWGVGNDWDRAVARTVGPGQTKVDEFLAPAGDTMWVQRQDSPTPFGGTAATLNDTAPTADQWNLATVEVLAAEGEATEPEEPEEEPEPEEETGEEEAEGGEEEGTPAPLSLDASVSAHQSSGGATISSPAISTSQAGELLLAFVASDGPNASGAQSVTGVSGGGLSWTLRRRANAQAGTAEIWQAVAPAKLTNATIAATRANGGYQGAIAVAAFEGAETSANGATAAGSAASGAPSVSLTTTRPGSWVWGVGDDWDSAKARTPGAGQELVDQFLSPSGDTFWTQRQAKATPAAGASVSIDDTAPSGDRWNLAAVEVPAAEAGESESGEGEEEAEEESGEEEGGEEAEEETSEEPSEVGKWGPLIPLPAVAIHSALLPTGRILLWQGDFASGGQQYVLNPGTGAVTQIPDAAADLFCAGQAVLADGRVLVIGGTSTSGGLGVPDLTAFEWHSQTWEALAPMHYPRWYATGTTLSDGKVLVTSGDNKNAGDIVAVPELYDPASNSWQSLTAASHTMPIYPFIYQLPDGRIVHLGGSEVPTTSEGLDLSTGQWTTIDGRVIDGGSIANYAPGRFIKAGSAADDGYSGNSASTAYTLDMNQPGSIWQPTSSMKYPRSFLNLTNLPDGTVLATGGGTDKSGFVDSHAVPQAEDWNPGTGAWRTYAAMSAPRLYHSVAVLLPDGRVYVAGGGGDPGVTDQRSAQIFSPPYLFRGPRPTIESAPAIGEYGQSQFVATPDGASISRVSLIRTGSVTHAFDQNARATSLSFIQTSGGIDVQMPANRDEIPPGYYMLFIVNGEGVPSVASFVRFPAPSESGEEPEEEAEPEEETGEEEAEGGEEEGTPAPLSLDASVSAHQSSGGATISSPAISTSQAGELLLAFVASDGPNASGAQSVTGVSGGGLSWTLRRRANAQAGTAEIWQAVAPAKLTNATIAATRANGGYQGAIAVAAFEGAETSANGATAAGSAASGAPSVSLTTTRPGSWVWGVGDDWDSAKARTPGAGQELVDQFLSPSGDTFWTQRQAKATPAAGASVSIDDTAPSGDRWNLAAVEVPAASETP